MDLGALQEDLLPRRPQAMFIQAGTKGHGSGAGGTWVGLGRTTATIQCPWGWIQGYSVNSEVKRADPESSAAENESWW